jgi:hypothetical protein
MTATARASASCRRIAGTAGGVRTSSSGPSVVPAAATGRRRCRAPRHLHGRRRRIHEGRRTPRGRRESRGFSLSWARSSWLRMTAAGRPLRVTVTRSCSCSTRSTTSLKWSRTSRNDSVLMAQLWRRPPQALPGADLLLPHSAACRARCWGPSSGAAADVASVVDAEHDHFVQALIDSIQDSLGAATRGVDPGQITANRFPAR